MDRHTQELGSAPAIELAGLAARGLVVDLGLALRLPRRMERDGPDVARSGPIAQPEAEDSTPAGVRDRAIRRPAPSCGLTAFPDIQTFRPAGRSCDFLRGRRGGHGAVHERGHDPRRKRADGHRRRRMDLARGRAGLWYWRRSRGNGRQVAQRLTMRRPPRSGAQAAPRRHVLPGADGKPPRSRL